MTKQETALRACAILEEYYPKSVCALQYKEPYELLIAVRLSAQCTDARVNIVTKTLFQQYPTLESFAAANLEELEQAVKPCGFYHMKAKSIKEMAIRLLTVYDGKIPDTMEELLTLPGVGRKTAKLILGERISVIPLCIRYSRKPLAMPSCILNIALSLGLRIDTGRRSKMVLSAMPSSCFLLITIGRGAAGSDKISTSCI